MGDDDLIRREDALKVVSVYGTVVSQTAEIRAIPAASSEDVRAGAQMADLSLPALLKQTREDALKEAAEAWDAFKAANTTVDHWKAVERLNAALGAKP